MAKGRKACPQVRSLNAPFCRRGSCVGLKPSFAFCLRVAKPLANHINVDSTAVEEGGGVCWALDALLDAKRGS